MARTYQEVVSDTQMMQAAKDIREWLCLISGVWERLHDSPNPFYGNTLDGLILIASRGNPCSVGTPFGEWALSGGGSSRASWIAKATERLGLVELHPLAIVDQVEVGPVWAITKDLDGKVLPKTEFVMPAAKYIHVSSKSIFSEFSAVDLCAEARRAGAIQPQYSDFVYPEDLSVDEIKRDAAYWLSSHLFDTSIKPVVGFVEGSDTQ